MEPGKTPPAARTAGSQQRVVRRTALVCVAGLGLLLTSCQMVLPVDHPRSQGAEQSRQAPDQGRVESPVAPPVPEIVWDEPPPCESQDPHQSQDQQVLCARLVYRAGTEVRELIWSEEGVGQTAQPLTDLPSGVSSFSPDFTRLVVQTPHGHTAGGPLYLYNLETEQLVNLNEQIGLPSNTGVSALRVAGWHPEGQQLLLVNEDDEVTIWLDLANETYQALALGIDTSQMAPPRHFTLAPDGSGFTFDTIKRAATGRDMQAAYLYRYDLATAETRLILTVPATQGQLAIAAIAPDGEQLVYLLQRGGRSQGRSQEVYLMALNAGETDGATAAATDSRLLLAGNLGPTVPVWSPDGESIALVRRDLAEPLRAGPHQPPPLGDIWTIAIDSEEATRLTFTEALERPPVWSPDGRYLAFVTADGQIGMVAVAAPGEIWQLDDAASQPQFMEIAFAPVEESR